MKITFLLLAPFLLVACLTEPEPKDKTIKVDCRNSFDYEDSAGVMHFSCRVDPQGDPKPPAPGAK